MSRDDRRQVALQEKVRSLQTAAQLSRGRADETVVAEAERVCSQADRRLAFGGNAVVVALAGATGSGKSTTFNALSKTTLATTGVRRPTTSSVLGASWADDEHPQSEMDEVLSWLEVPNRHAITGGDPTLGGLVLLDLPDHDSTQLAHRLEVDRLVKLVDVFVWVVDPQKYADAALHDSYLRPLADHAANMLVVLNQADRVPASELPRMLKDLRRLLDSEGLRDAELLAASAATGEGMEAIRHRLAKIAKDKRAAGRRLETDIARAASALAAQTGMSDEPDIEHGTLQGLTRDLADAAGAETVTEAVKNAWRRRGAKATGWPVVSWAAGLRPDPLKRLHLDHLPELTASSGRNKELAPTSEQRTSLPHLGGVARSRIDAAVRRVSDDASRGLPEGWADAVTQAAQSSQRQLPDDLDRAIASTDLKMNSGNGWWWLIRVLQWILIVALVVGVGWLGLNYALAYFQFPLLPLPHWHRLPIATWLALGGLGGGILLALLSRIFVEWGARAKAAAARRALQHQIETVCRAEITQPVEAVLADHRRVRESLGAIR